MHARCPPSRPLPVPAELYRCAGSARGPPPLCLFTIVAQLCQLIVHHSTIFIQSPPYYLPIINPLSRYYYLLITLLIIGRFW